MDRFSENVEAEIRKVVERVSGIIASGFLFNPQGLVVGMTSGFRYSSLLAIITLCRRYKENF